MKRRILMLTSQYLPEVFGGAEQQCKRLSEELAGRGHDVTILTSCTDPANTGDAEEGGIRVVRLFAKHPPQMMGRRIASSLKWSGAVKTWMRQNQSAFDLVHCHQGKFNAWIGTQMAMKLGKPSLVKIGNAGDRMDLLRLSKKRFVYGIRLAQSIIAKAGKFVVISTDMAHDLERFGIKKSRITYIPNGIRAPDQVQTITPALRNQTRLDLGLPSEAQVFLFTGRLDRQKNVATLIDGFGRTAGNHSNALLLIVGAGDEEAALKTQAANQIPDGQVRFLGRQENIWPLYQAADCFVLPALAEGLSNSLLEAQVCGLPVIATKVSGTNDFVDDGKSGLLFEPRDGSALSDHLTTVLAMSEANRTAMGKRGQEYVRQHANFEIVAANYEALYSELLTSASNSIENV